MKRALVLFALALAPAAFAQAGDLPPGHPPVGGAPAPAAPATGSPHGEEPPPVPDQVLPAKDLPAGSIEAKIVDEREKPLPNTEVRLGILRQTVAEGEARSHRTAKTNAEGIVRFDGLPTGSDHSYRVTVKKDPAEYASTPFPLGRDAGQRVLLHVYPVTSDVNRALVGMRGIFVVEARDDVFHFQVMFRVFNMGRVTWVPEDVTVDLPPGWKGFSAQESMSDTRFVADGENVRLLGTISPGEHDATFTFQVPNDHEEDAEFRIGLPPHVAELRVIAEAARGMGLEVSGFEAAQPSSAPGGQRVLVTARRLQPGEPEMRSVTLRLSGIPTPGPGRWIAAFLAIAVAALGLAAALSRPKERAPNRDLEQARELLLAELVALEKALESGAIGPRTHESAKRALLDAVARLDARRERKSTRQKSTAGELVAEP